MNLGKLFLALLMIINTITITLSVILIYKQSHNWGNGVVIFIGAVIILYSLKILASDDKQTKGDKL